MAFRSILGDLPGHHGEAPDDPDSGFNDGHHDTARETRSRTEEIDRPRRCHDDLLFCELGSIIADENTQQYSDSMSRTAVPAHLPSPFISIDPTPYTTSSAITATGVHMTTMTTALVYPVSPQPTPYQASSTSMSTDSPEDHNHHHINTSSTSSTTATATQTTPAELSRDASNPAVGWGSLAGIITGTVMAVVIMLAWFAIYQWRRIKRSQGRRLKQEYGQYWKERSDTGLDTTSETPTPELPPELHAPRLGIDNPAELDSLRPPAELSTGWKGKGKWEVGSSP